MMSKNHDYTILTPKKVVVAGLLTAAIVIFVYKDELGTNNIQISIEELLKPIKKLLTPQQNNLSETPEILPITPFISPTDQPSPSPSLPPTKIPQKGSAPKNRFVIPSPTPFPTWQTKSYEELRREQDEWFRKVQEENRRKSEESKKALEQFRQESQKRLEEFKKQAEEGFSLPKLD